MKKKEYSIGKLKTEWRKKESYPKRFQIFDVYPLFISNLQIYYPPKFKQNILDFYSLKVNLYPQIFNILSYFDEFAFISFVSLLLSINNKKVIASLISHDRRTPNQALQYGCLHAEK